VFPVNKILKLFQRLPAASFLNFLKYCVILITGLCRSAGTYLSGWLLRSATGATPATTATLQLRLMGLAQYPTGTNVFGAYAKWLVKINVHELGTGTGAAGV